MNLKSISIPILAACVTFLTTSISFGDPKPEEKIVVSITMIYHQKISRTDSVTIQMTIHVPTRLAGSQFTIVTDSTDRAEVRKEFPVGSLQSVELPGQLVKKFEADIKAHASVESSLDAGVDPMMISQAFEVPSVAMAELPARPQTVEIVK
jgi:hypothetical protein